ncbi:MAG TPA: tetratricopeptide repeat protein [Methylomirabilota bacterium]|jgi:tetratricopeptide (TPR) repeat protein|nr:tetratricopeptide repeat protein [Methylomirabilota bacterium]
MKIVVMLATLLALAGPVVAEPREDALKALENRTDAVARRQGLRTLAAAGTMADVPRIAQALRDPDRAVRILAEASLWEIWSRSGDKEIDRLFAAGVQELSEGRWDDAVTTFTKVIARKPEFAEGWNKRATVYYLMGEYQKSLADCDEVMKRNPFHYGALSGYGMIYGQLDQPLRALEFYEQALGVNPNLDGVRNAIEILRDELIRKRRESI